MDSQALRRAAALSRHFMPSPDGLSSPPPSFSGVGMVPTANDENGKSDKYRRVHGNVLSHPISWRACLDDGPPFTDIIYEKAVGEGIAKITINRPEKRNAFRPQTEKEIRRALTDAQEDTSIGVIILTGKGNEAFCSGGDQSVRGDRGYSNNDGSGRLSVLDTQIQIRQLPKPVIAMVAGYCIGGGHVLHMVCDLTIAADNAIFGQTGPKVGSCDPGYGCSIMSQLIGTKRAREMWFLTRFYSAKQAMEMGLINAVVPLEKLEEETVKWCREILRNSPTAIRICKTALNAVDEAPAGLPQMGINAVRLFYDTEEAAEGKNAFLQRRQPDFSKFPRLP